MGKAKKDSKALKGKARGRLESRMAYVISMVKASFEAFIRTTPIGHPN